MFRSRFTRPLVSELRGWIRHITTAAHNSGQTVAKLDVGQLEDRTMFSASPLALIGDVLADASSEADTDVTSAGIDCFCDHQPDSEDLQNIALSGELDDQATNSLSSHDPEHLDHDGHEDHVQYDAFGNEVYVDINTSFVDESVTDSTLTSPESGSVPFGDTFQLHSNSGAAHTIYLDFNGHVTSGTYWNNSYNGGQDFVTPAYDFDGDTSTFSDAELERIQNIWQRVAEDFAPFDVNVTTADPGVDLLSKDGSGDTAWGVRVVIGGSSHDWLGQGAGGAAYVGSFNWNDIPAFVFEDNLGNGNEKYTAEAISHEAGHALGLSHDGGDGTSYYRGHGSGDTGWASIMGTAYYKEVSQWSSGEYSGATNTQDDLSIITSRNGFGYRLDDHGDTNSDATSLLVSGSSVSGSGIIEQNTDFDVFSFTTDGGSLDLAINAFERGANLDILAELYDAANNLVYSSNPLGALNATINTVVSAGTYFLHITGVGEGDPSGTGYSDYGSLGQYSISGNVTPSTAEILSISGLNADQVEGDSGNSVFTFTITRSGDVSSSTTVDYSVTGNGTDGADAADFVNGVLPGGTVTFAAGEASKTISVSVAGDALVEADESFAVTLSNASGPAQILGDTAFGTIRNDDVAPPTEEFLAISATDTQKLEGDSGSTTFTFTVTRSGDTSGSTTVDYSVNGSSPNPVDEADFGGVLPGGTLTFADGEVTKTISIDVAADTQVEADETFSVQLLNASGDAQISGDTANGTIVNDDVSATPGISVTPTSGLTTKENGSSVSFTVVLDTKPIDDVIIDVVSLDETEGTVSTSQLVFTAANWDTVQQVVVTGVDDGLRDGHVAYGIQLTASESNQGAYAGVDPDDVIITNQDNEKGSKKDSGDSTDGGGGGKGGGKGKPTRAAELGDQVMDDFLAQFGSDNGLDLALNLTLDLNDHAQSSAQIDALLDRFATGLTGNADSDDREESSSVEQLTL